MKLFISKRMFEEKYQVKRKVNYISRAFKNHKDEVSCRILVGTLNGVGRGWREALTLALDLAPQG